MKTRLVLIISICVQVICAKELPVPDHYFLYTDFSSQRSSPFLKKTVDGSGYIVMNGKEEFAFKQKTPAEITIVRKNGVISFRKGNAAPIIIASSSEDAENSALTLLFSGDTEKIHEIFSIEENTYEEMDQFTLTPKEGQKTFASISSIFIESSGDKIKKMELHYKNKTSLSYQFYNSVTGKVPDEKLLQ